MANGKKFAHTVGLEVKKQPTASKCKAEKDSRSAGLVAPLADATATIKPCVVRLEQGLTGSLVNNSLVKEHRPRSPARLRTLAKKPSGYKERPPTKINQSPSTGQAENTRTSNLRPPGPKSTPGLVKALSDGLLRRLRPPAVHRLPLLVPVRLQAQTTQVGLALVDADPALLLGLPLALGRWTFSSNGTATKIVAVSVAELPLFWAAPDVRGPGVNSGSGSKQKSGSGTRQKRPAPGGSKIYNSISEKFNY